MPALRRFDFSAAPLLLLAIVLLIAGPSLAHPLAAQTLTGTVYDSTMAAPLVGARVVVSGTDRTAVTDAEGRFRLDGLDPGEYVVGFFHARLEELDVAPRGREVRLRAGETVELALAVPSVATIADARGPQRVQIAVRDPSVVVGRVLDRDTDGPVGDAIVRLRGSGFETLTDTLGWFAFPQVPTGDYLLEIEHIAYGTQGDSLSVPRGETVEVVFRASTQAIALEPIEVRVLSEIELRRRASGFAHHMIIARDDIDEYFMRGAIHVGDIVRMHKGVAVSVHPQTLQRGNIPGVCIQDSRRRPSVSVGTAILGGGSGDCPRLVALVVDGMMIAPSRGGLRAAELKDLPIYAMESVEYLPPPLAVMRYGLTAAHGAIVVETRSGLDRDRRRASGEQIASEMRNRMVLSARSPRWEYWAVGGLAGFGAGVAYVVGHDLFLDPCPAGRCSHALAGFLPSLATGTALGWLSGEVVYLLRR